MTPQKIHVKIYNTLTRKKEEFSPLDGKTARMYVCGITPYDSVHLGHARCYVAFDVIKRFLVKRGGYEVRHIQNFTDVDDKIIARATRDGISPSELASRYIAEYFNLIKKLNVIDADVYPRVTETIPEIIRLTEKLISSGFAYESGGDVYFAVRKFKGYGKLSGRSIDELLSGARVEPSDKKSDPLDFALWKKSKEGEPSWDSPWGKGRPGWHIECSAMAQKFLGETIDIHGGGQDLIFPHHENEIAQSEAATGKPFARFFIHNGFVTINSEKMSKSLGNFFTLKDIFERYDPMVVRYFLISQHYRSPLDFSDEGLEQARRASGRILNAAGLTEKLPTDKGEEENPATYQSLMEKFDSAMSDDFNTSAALACLHSAADIIFKSNGSKEEKLEAGKAIFEMAEILGLDISDKNFTAAPPPDEVLRLGKAREDARKTKNFKLADEIREKIKSLGYAIEDTREGTKFKKIQ